MRVTSIVGEILLGLHFVIAQAELLATTSNVCLALSNTSPGLVHFPGSDSYAVYNTYWASNTQLHPPCIFTPSSSADVAAAVSLFVSKEGQFAVRSGGHAFIPGWSSTSAGPVINLKNLNQTTLLDGNSKVKVGSGAQWVDVYDALQPQGYTVPGGRADSIGVGGLTLGGGFSYFLYEKGFSCDAVVEFEVVLANGTLTTASASHNPDLFWGLKGSGNILGIVTHFTFEAIKVGPQIYGGTIYSAGSTIPQIADALADYAQTDFDPKAHLISVFIKTTSLNTSMAINIYFYQTIPPQGQAPEVFQKLMNVDHRSILKNTVGPRTIGSLSRELGAQGAGTRQYYMPFTMTDPDAATITDLWNIASEEFNELFSGSTPGLLLSLDMVPYGTTTVEAGNEAGGNVLGLEEGTNYMNMHYYVQWTQGANDDAVISATKTAYARSVALLKDRSKYSPFIYMNYASPDQDVLGSYGEASLQRLRSMKTTYDPDGVFDNLVAGGFKFRNGEYIYRIKSKPKHSGEG